MLVIGLNQTIDRTVQLPMLEPGHVLRATGVVVTAGGKAVNVCRAAVTLAAAPTLVGLFPGRLGRVAVELLAGERLDVVPVAVDGELRGTTIAIERSGRTTVVNEPGPPLDDDGWRRLLDAVRAALGPGAVVAISGSSPPDTPADAVATLIDLVHEHDGFVAVDTTGEALRLATAAGADLVSPNLAEAEGAISGSAGGGTTPEQREAVEPGDDADDEAVRHRTVTAAAALVDAGAGAAIVSAGRHGAAYCSATDDDGFVAAPFVDVVNPIGAGDALLGAVLVAVERGRPLAEAVRRGVAYAAASVAHPTAGYADRALVARLTGDLAGQEAAR